MSSKPQKGRLRFCDDSHEKIGSNMDVLRRHTKEMNETKKQQNQLETRCGHCSLINQIMIFWKDHYPNYLKHGA